MSLSAPDCGCQRLCLPQRRMQHQGRSTCRQPSGGASGLAMLEGGTVHRQNDPVVRAPVATEKVP